MNRRFKKSWAALLITMLVVMAAVFSPGAAQAATTDILYDGTVNLVAADSFEATAYNSSSKYTVSEATPLGALQA
ncbi:MAG: hypothetical protein PHG75_03230, partial [Syntrophomonas sp.]|nr:hypothetical protein [Syntrophomonas sp.]